MTHRSAHSGSVALFVCFLLTTLSTPTAEAQTDLTSAQPDLRLHVTHAGFIDASWPPEVIALVRHRESVRRSLHGPVGIVALPMGLGAIGILTTAIMGVVVQNSYADARGSRSDARFTRGVGYGVSVPLVLVDFIPLVRALRRRARAREELRRVDEELHDHGVHLAYGWPDAR